MRMRAALLLLAIGVTACGRPLRRMPVQQPVGTPTALDVRQLPVGPTERERLRALPQVSSYRWGAPRNHFRGLSPTEDSAAVSFAAHNLRTFGASVLRTNGWYEAGDTIAPRYELSIVEFERHVTEMQQVERSAPATPTRPQEWSRCRALPAAQRANCVEPPPPSPTATGTTQTVRTVVPRRFVALAIVRLSDGATVWWITDRREDLLTAQVRLLAAPPEP
jgi:hypothetical protein